MDAALLVKLERWTDKTSTCWLWTGAKSDKGYGQVRVKGKLWYAHRAYYAVTYGEIPKGKFICHKCDTPLCVRPDHMFVGDASRNSLDMVEKRRQATGVRNGVFRSGSATDVEHIQTLAWYGADDRAIAKSLRLGIGWVRAVVRR